MHVTEKGLLMRLQAFAKGNVEDDGKTNLCSDDVELELLPVIVGLFEGLHLVSNIRIRYAI